MSIYQHGDKVIVKTAEEMKTEFGDEWRASNGCGSEIPTPGFIGSMDYLLGREVTVDHTRGNDWFKISESIYTLCDRYVRTEAESWEVCDPFDELLCE